MWHAAAWLCACRAVSWGSTGDGESCQGRGKCRAHTGIDAGVMGQPAMCAGAVACSGQLCVEVGSKVAGSKVGSCDMGRGVSWGQSWCPSLEPAGSRLPGGW